MRKLMGLGVSIKVLSVNTINVPLTLDLQRNCLNSINRFQCHYIDLLPKVNDSRHRTSTLEHSGLILQLDLYSPLSQQNGRNNSR